MKFKKPKVVISKCINISPVRYNGGIIKDDFVEKLMQFIEVIPVCPEVEAGMSVPRETVILYNKKEEIKMIEPKSKTDFTEKMNNFSYNFLKKLNNIDGFILKSKSPSCGLKDTKIYKENLKEVINYRGNGLFTLKVLEFFSNFPVETEKRLKNYWIRRDFLTKIFALAELRTLEENFKDINQLLDFHKNYKYILMLYDANKLKKMGALLANWKDFGLNQTLKEYSQLFKETLSKKSNTNKHLNVIEHIYGHFKEKLSLKEKKHILNMINKFKKEKLELESLLEYLRGFIYRFDDLYLQSQRYLFSYPQELEENII